MNWTPQYPQPLIVGSRIAVTAPSSGVEPALHRRLELVLDHLRQQGFQVEEGSCLRDQQRSASASAEQRAAELMDFLCRDDIAAVMPPWGGELAIELLDRLDWAALGGTRPKWLLGYSDTSTLLLPLTLRLGWATAHGPGLMDLVAGQHDPLTRAVMATLATPAGGSILQRQSSHWQSRWTDFALVPDTVYDLSEPTRWRCLNRTGNVTFSGRLMGGCLDTLMHIADTEYGNARDFVSRCGTAGCVLYLENSSLTPTDLVRALHRLRWAGWLDGLAGVLVGRSAAPDSTDPREMRHDEALAHMLATLPCPVLADVDIGHKPPQMILINAALAEVSWSSAAGGQVLQHLV